MGELNGDGRWAMSEVGSLENEEKATVILSSPLAVRSSSIVDQLPGRMGD
jgi:hypothetical protein